jgi:hypothetical protein
MPNALVTAPLFLHHARPWEDNRCIHHNGSWEEPMGRVTDARQVTPHDVSGNYYGDHKSPNDGTLRCGDQASRSVGLDSEVAQVPGS